MQCEHHGWRVLQIRGTKRRRASGNQLFRFRCGCCLDSKARAQDHNNEATTSTTMNPRGIVVVMH